MTAASLKEYTVKDLAQMAKDRGVAGWHSMRKDQLVRALVKTERSGSSRNRGSSKSGVKSASTSRRIASSRKSAAKSTSGKRGASSHRNGSSRPPRAAENGKSKSAPAPANARPRSSLRRIEELHREREARHDLSSSGFRNGQRKQVAKNRVVLIVRDAYWLQATWEFTRQSVERARAAMGAYWHTAKPTLRLLDSPGGNVTNTADTVIRDIEIHGGVNNWYIDVKDSPKTFRVDIGYLASNGKFYSLGRSNSVTTPAPGSSSTVEGHWADIAKNGDHIFALSGGYEASNARGDLQELFEEQLRRPMGSPLTTNFGPGAGNLPRTDDDFTFEVDAEMIIYGVTHPDAFVSISNDPVKLREDGSFTVRLSMPDRRQVLPLVAASSDGLEQRTVVLSVNRNTKVMEPVSRDPAE